MSTTTPTPRTGNVLRRAGRDLLDLLTGPHGVDRYVELLDPRLASDRHVAEVVAVHHETRDVVTLTMTPPRGWATGTLPRPRHGQAVNVTVEVDGARVTRSFSVASLTPTRWTITVKANPTGTVSKHLVAHARVGMLVEVSAPFGRMVLPADHGVRDGLLLISGGSGITPVMAMLRELQRAGRLARHGSRQAETPGVLPQVAFLHYTPTPDDLIFAEELAELADAYVNLDVVVVHTDVVATEGRAGAHALGDDRGLTGFFSDEHVAALRGVDPSTAQVFVCGPRPLSEAVTAWVGDEARLHTEYFQPPTTGGADPDATGSITLTVTGTTFENDGRSLLEQAEDAGLSPAHGCRMGICHTCTRSVTSGSVRNLLNGQVATATDAAPVAAQICVSTAHGDCAIDL